MFKVDGPDGQIRHPDYKTERAAWIVFENNRIEKAQLTLSNGTEHMMVRNNVIDYDDKVSIAIDGYSSTFSRQVTDVYILNNTAVNDGTIGSFLSLGGGSDGITVNNNLYVAPQLTTGANMTAVIYVKDNDLSGFREINNNIWPVAETLGYAEGGYFYCWPSWSDKKGYLSPSEWSAYSQTGQDLYQNVTLPASVYQVTKGNVTAGAKLAA